MQTEKSHSSKDDLSNITVRPTRKQRMKLANLVANMTRMEGKSVSFNAAILSLIDKLPDSDVQDQPDRRKKASKSVPADSATEAK